MPESHRKPFFRLAIALLAVVLASLAVFSLWLPVLRVTGASMNPTLKDGDLVLAVRGGRVETGDVIAFSLDGHILLKRVVAAAGQAVNMDGSGNLYVDGFPVEEPYLAQPAVGEWTVPMPCTVPEGKVFVLGDARTVSMDSRNALVGCVGQEQILGKLVFRLWPLSAAGRIR